MSRNPVVVVVGVVALIALSLIVAVLGIRLASELIPGDASKEGRIGLLALLPMWWLWRSFFSWCGVKF